MDCSSFFVQRKMPVARCDAGSRGWHLPYRIPYWHYSGTILMLWWCCYIARSALDLVCIIFLWDTLPTFFCNSSYRGDSPRIGRHPRVGERASGVFCLWCFALMRRTRLSLCVCVSLTLSLESFRSRMRTAGVLTAVEREARQQTTNVVHRISGASVQVHGHRLFTQLCASSEIEVAFGPPQQHAVGHRNLHAPTSWQFSMCD